MNRKTYALLGTCLAAGIGLFAYKSYLEPRPLYLKPEPAGTPVLQESSRGLDAGYAREKSSSPDGLPDLARDAASRRRARHSLSELLQAFDATPPLPPAPRASRPGYTIEESIRIADESTHDLYELFSNDCQGRCFYLYDGEGMVTKVQVNDNSPILEWYDEVSNCMQFTGEFWLYLDPEGTIKAWGVHRDSKIGATKLARPCE